MAKPPTSNRSIRLADDVWALLEAKAQERGIRVNAAVAEAVADWLGLETLSRPVKKVSEPVSLVKASSLVSTPEGARLSAPRRDTGAAWGFNPKGKAK